jgi:hypothetical protein
MVEVNLEACLADDIAEFIDLLHGDHLSHERGMGGKHLAAKTRHVELGSGTVWPAFSCPLL